MEERKPKLYYSRSEMEAINIQTLKNRGVEIDDIAIIAYNQQKKYSSKVTMEECRESVLKILSLRDVFHLVQLGVEIDKIIIIPSE